MKFNICLNYFEIFYFYFMTINQLFKNKPPIDLINKILNSFNIDGVDCERIFSVKTMELNNAIIKSRPLLKELEEYYLPCKQKVDVYKLTNKKLITIIKQLLRIHQYMLVSIEKYSNGNKFIVYQIKSREEVLEKQNKTKIPVHQIIKDNITLKFD